MKLASASSSAPHETSAMLLAKSPTALKNEVNEEPMDATGGPVTPSTVRDVRPRAPAPLGQSPEVAGEAVGGQDPLRRPGAARPPVRVQAVAVPVACERAQRVQAHPLASAFLVRPDEPHRRS